MERAARKLGNFEECELCLVHDFQSRGEFIILEHAGGTLSGWKLTGQDFPPERGDMVALNRKAKTLVYGDEYVIRLKGPLVQCALCDQWMFQNDVAAHSVRFHPTAWCSHCGEKVETRLWSDHIARHLREKGGR
jgi:hypothetical protein